MRARTLARALMLGAISLTLLACSDSSQEAATSPDAGELDADNPGLDAADDSIAVGSISGTVTTSNPGAPIEGATVVTTPGAWEGQSDGLGQFTITDLPAGVYDLTASAIGYSEATETGVEVIENAVTEVSFVLDAIETYSTTCASCHLDSDKLLASLEADPLPEKGGESGSSGEG